MSQNGNHIVTAESVTGLATHFIKSGWFKDVGDISKAVVKIMAGQELGLLPFTSMTSINVVQGKPELSARLISSLIKQSGKYRYKILEQTAQKCEIEFFENFEGKFESLGSVSFTIEEARKAGLTNKPPWISWPSDMLFARTISRGARRFCPDVFNGQPVYVEGEIDAGKEEKTLPPPLNPPLNNEDGEVPPKAFQIRKIEELVTEIAENLKVPKEELEQKLKDNSKIKDYNEMSVEKAAKLISSLKERLEQIKAIQKDKSKELESKTPAAPSEPEKPKTEETSQKDGAIFENKVQPTKF